MSSQVNKFNHFSEEGHIDHPILKRRKTPSLLKTLSLTGVKSLLWCNIFLFFKYRSSNKFLVTVMENHYTENDSLAGCWLLSSEIVQIVTGYLIMRWFKGRRYFIQGIIMVILILSETIQVILYGIIEEN